MSPSRGIYIYTLKLILNKFLYSVEKTKICDNDLNRE